MKMGKAEKANNKIQKTGAGPTGIAEEFARF
jgi:hypothetical protein